MPETHEHLGAAIKARREELGLSQAQLCERLGWQKTRATEISGIENGKFSDLKFSRLSLMAQALAIPVSELVKSLSAKEAV